MRGAHLARTPVKHRDLGLGNLPAVLGRSSAKATTLVPGEPGCLLA
jgi:hypothetical protein